MENHAIIIEKRERISVTAVTDVSSANEDAVLISLEQGGLMVKGQRLHIQKLDLAEGKIIIDGDIASAVYTEKKSKGEKDLLKKLLK